MKYHVGGKYQEISRIYLGRGKYQEIPRIYLRRGKYKEISRDIKVISRRRQIIIKKHQGYM